STSTASSFAHTTSPSFASRVTSLEGMQMDIHHILSELQAERARLDRVITALEGLSAGSAPRRGRPAKPEQSSTAVPHKKTMSAAARAKISAARLLPPSQHAPKVASRQPDANG